MRNEVTLRYTEPLVRRAIFEFWKRTVGVGFPIAMLLCAASLILLQLEGDRSWFSGIVGSVLILGLGLCAVLYFSHFRNSMTKFRALKNSEAFFKVDSNTFTLASSEGSSTMPWKTVSEVWKFESFWLLLFSKAQFVTLPLDSLPVELREFVSERAIEAGGKVDT